MSPVFLAHVQYQPFMSSMIDQTGETYENPNSDEFYLNKFPDMLDAAECWIFCRTFFFLRSLLLKRWMPFSLLWVVGVCGADVLEGDRQTCPQVMDFGLVLLRFLIICGGRAMFTHCLEERYFSSDFYPWSGAV